MSVRTFQKTFGFWFTVATINGFFGGMATAVLLHDLGVWR